MPYRRLPNTDKARIRALKAALYAYENSNKGNVVLSVKTVYNLKLKLREFLSEVDSYNEAFSNQTINQKNHKSIFHLCKLYISHFIQVVNFAIVRGELDKNVRKSYGLKVNSTSLPTLSSEKQIISWAEKIISGEKNRIANGQRAISNPSVNDLKVHLDKFIDSVNFQKNLQNRTSYAQSKLVKTRPEIDLFIKELWDEIEKYFFKYPPLVRREKAKVFGIKYIYRKNEDKIELEDLLK